MLPKALKSCPKSKKSPNLVTLYGRLIAYFYLIPIQLKPDPYSRTMQISNCHSQTSGPFEKSEIKSYLCDVIKGGVGQDLDEPPVVEGIGRAAEVRLDGHAGQVLGRLFPLGPAVDLRAAGRVEQDRIPQIPVCWNDLKWV